MQLLGNGSWHDVFFNGWVEEFVPIAQLVCHSLGFTGGVTRGGSWHGSDPEPGIAELECGPGAAGLNSCKFASAEFPTTDGEHVIAGLACDGERGLRGWWVRRVSLLRLALLCDATMCCTVHPAAVLPRPCCTAQLLAFDNRPCLPLHHQELWRR